MALLIGDFKKGQVVTVNVANRRRNPHHGIVLEIDPVSQQLTIAVSTSGKLPWHETGYGYPVKLDWSQKPQSGYCDKWPKGAGESLYYGAYTREYSPSDCVEIVGSGVPAPTMAHMLANRKKYRDVAAREDEGARRQSGGGASRRRL